MSGPIDNPWVEVKEGRYASLAFSCPTCGDQHDVEFNNDEIDVSTIEFVCDGCDTQIAVDLQATVQYLASEPDDALPGVG